jgi:Rrf2 family nitric oxide-sensitive transcriptional repressor
LAKIMAALVQGGIVRTRRGGGGGARLARPAAEIRLGEVIRLLEDGHALVECFATPGGICSIGGVCRLRGRLRSAEAAFLADLNRSTLADVALPSNAGAAVPAF